MKIKTTVLSAGATLGLGLLLFSSCQKDDAVTATDEASSSTIAVLSSASVADADTVYLLQTCRRGEQRESIGETSLPDAATDYLAAHYPGYTFHKAFTLKAQGGTISGYVAIVYYNDKPVGLQFDSAGTFVKVLEQRERGDLRGPGWHRGGHFEHRDGQQRDVIALDALPASVRDYFAANYASDVLVKAFRNRDNSIVVISQNNGVFATIFDRDGNFVKREELAQRRGQPQAIEQSALPAAIATYLTNTYPNYVFKKAFTLTDNGSVTAYVVVIDANNTKYAVHFDAAGNFVWVKTIY